MSIYVVAHKQSNRLLSLPEGYVPLFVGENSHQLAEAFPSANTDDSGDNIARRNAEYCELTAMYWIWKNRQDKIKGLVHYRRYFQIDTKNGMSKISIKDIDDVLNQYDLILPKRYPLMTSMEKHYAKHHVQSDMFLLESAVKKNCPEYLDALKVCMKAHSFHPYNMLVANNTTFDSYCEWLFPLIGEVEAMRNSGDTSNDAYQRRWAGFLSERMMDVWVLHNNLAVFECQVPLEEITLKQRMSLLLGSVICKLNGEEAN